MNTPKTRIVVVDDSSLVRRLVLQALAEEPGFEVVGQAADGIEGLSVVSRLRPDAVVLDIEMPKMDGLQMLRELRKGHPKLPVIMFSTLTERGAEATLEALSFGANDYVTKPTNSSGLAESMQEVRRNLAGRIRTFCARNLAPPGPPPTVAVRSAPVRPAGSPVSTTSAVQAVVIGVSTGGPPALARLIPALPPNLGVPVLIVQHMPPLFTKQLAQSLAAKSRLPVKEAVEGAEILPNTVWIAPGNFHMEVFKSGSTSRIRLHQGPPENSCRPAVDVLFRSAAKTWGSNTLGVVLTGMGQDGLKGSEAITAANGWVVCQDEASSVVWGMPGAVAKAQLADHIVPLDQIASNIIRIVQGSNAAPQPARSGS